MSYSIFRVQGIKTLSDLRGIGKHNAERVSYTNLDIDREKSKENIELIQCESYRNRFNEITKEMKADHDKRMETTRSDRRKTFEQALDTAKNDVACEFLFTSDQEFFEGKSKEEIQEWAETSLDFLRKDIGISEDRIIHASVHMDEKTPHLHVVAVPIIKAYDGRRKANTWQISRKKFIPTKDDLTRLQDIYNERMNEAGYNLERGTK
ncbi:MobV family relaxase, partial [Bacillus cereus group sp. BceL128]